MRRSSSTSRSSGSRSGRIGARRTRVPRPVLGPCRITTHHARPEDGPWHPAMPQPRKLHDRFFKQAKAEGYAARSAYKLIEINDKKRLVRSGSRVLDLGCAPGSWLQVVEKIIGERGLALGIDLQQVEIRVGPRVRVIQGDAFKIDPKELTDFAGGTFDVVLSDMAP